ncbi:MAG: hypothetical protein O7D91_17650 [Planctomycetota bacterium]|nr:hypothetical protein [Planctomycetota bacterium]
MSDPTTIAANCERVLGLCDDATDGPWHHGFTTRGSHNVYRDDTTDVTDPGANMAPEDAEFCAASRADLPRFVRAVEYLLRELEVASAYAPMPTEYMALVNQRGARILNGEEVDDG